MVANETDGNTSKAIGNVLKKKKKWELPNCQQLPLNKSS